MLALQCNVFAKVIMLLQISFSCVQLWPKLTNSSSIYVTKLLITWERQRIALRARTNSTTTAIIARNTKQINLLLLLQSLNSLILPYSLTQENKNKLLFLSIHLGFCCSPLFLFIVAILYNDFYSFSLLQLHLQLSLIHISTYRVS